MEGGSSSGAEELTVNGLRDNDHISFSYSSDEDFLPHHMTTPTTGKPYSDEKDIWPGKEVNSDLETEREKRKSESLSLDQRRHRLCSIAPRTPVATPSLTTPSPCVGNGKFSRQPVSSSLQPSISETHTTRSKLESQTKETPSPISQSSSVSEKECWRPATVGFAARKKVEEDKEESEKVDKPLSLVLDSSSDDKLVLEDLRRKVGGAEVEGSEEVRENKLLAEQLDVSSSSSSEGEEMAKPRLKRQHLLSSDSESEDHTQPHPPRPSAQSSDRSTQDRARETTPPPPKEREVRKRVPESPSSTTKKLRLVDIDFTGGRMRLAPPRPSSKPRPHHSPNKPHPHISERPAQACHRKLSQVSASASNILKCKPIPRAHPPSKRSSGERSSKDAVLAAKFPQKRKLLDVPPPKAHHKSSKLKQLFGHS